MLRRSFQIGFTLLGILCIAKGAYIPAKAALAQVLMERAWDKTQAAYDITGQPALPWASMDARPAARLHLPNQDSHIVLSEDSGQALAFGPALMSGADLSPEKMIAIAAHKNTQFQSLKTMKTGEIIKLETPASDIMNYRVERFDIIDSHTGGLPAQGPDTLALVTCYPFNQLSFNGPMRYVVYARKVI